MRRTVSTVAAAVAVALSTVAPAVAVTGNYVEDHEHTGVGLVVSYDEDGEFAGRCSGTLISPTVVLTAGHCTYGAATARVYFEQDAGANYDPEAGVDPSSGYPETGGVTGTPITMPGYDDFATFPDTRDVGVVVLDQPATETYPGAEISELPVPGQLDAIAATTAKRHVRFTVSGYGVNYTNPAKLVSFRSRMMATATLTNLRSHLTDGYNLAHSGNPGGGKGGTCFGDSGGPVYLAGTDTIVAVTSFGLSAWTCSGPGFAYRVDQAEVLDWLTGILDEA